MTFLSPSRLLFDPALLLLLRKKIILHINSILYIVQTHFYPALFQHPRKSPPCNFTTFCISSKCLPSTFIRYFRVVQIAISVKFRCLQFSLDSSLNFYLAQDENEVIQHSAISMLQKQTAIAYIFLTPVTSYTTHINLGM